MVKAIRKSILSSDGLGLSNGLYIVGDSNARSLDIPHLPTLGAENPTSGVINFDVNQQELFNTFSQGDIVWHDAKSGIFRSILSDKANSNTLLVTEQCDNRCQFCSQPPNDLPDSELYQKATLSILNFNKLSYVGISGGEPTLNRKAFVSLLSILGQFGNKTPLHILTNGRSLSDNKFLDEINFSLSEKRIIWGIPLYGPCSSVHDGLVGAEAAFVETLQGLLNLGARGQFVELRIIPVQANLNYLIHLMEFVCGAIPFVGVVSIMNLEPKGWARNNYDKLYVSVRSQGEYLQEMINIAQLRGVSVRLFNYPLCLLPEDIRNHACQSISDWKNYYLPSCEPCDLKNKCGGFFTSANGGFLETVEPLKWIN